MNTTSFGEKSKQTEPSVTTERAFHPLSRRTKIVFRAFDNFPFGMLFYLDGEWGEDEAHGGDMAREWKCSMCIRCKQSYTRKACLRFLDLSNTLCLSLSLNFLGNSFHFPEGRCLYDEMRKETSGSSLFGEILDFVLARTCTPPISFFENTTPTEFKFETGIWQLLSVPMKNKFVGFLKLLWFLVIIDLFVLGSTTGKQ